MTSTSTIKEEKRLEDTAIDRPINWDSSATEASIKEQVVSETPSLHSLHEKREEDVVKVDKNDIVTETEDESQYLEGPTLWLIMLGLGLACLLVGLDNSILATAIPTITTTFNSLDDVGWYGSGFLITVCALQPTAGKIFTYFSLKWAYLAFLFVFELGSLICAVANSSAMLIVGRAIAGLGAAGVFSGALVIVSNLVVLRMRPLWTGVIVSMFGLSNVVGPLVGAAFTEHVSWRWCFYINLPLGGLTAIILLFFFKVPNRPLEKLPLREKVSHLDLPGLGLFIPAIIMILLVLQWGGHNYAWRSSTIIGLIVGFVLMISLYMLWQWRQGDDASIPPRIFLQRNMWSACIILFFGLGSVILAAYYLPLWFQVVLGDTPIGSGVRFLPTVLANFVMGMVSGGLVTQYGYYNPWLFFGAMTAIVSSAVYTTWQVGESNSMIIGIQVLMGAGTPMLIQMPLIGLMATLPEIDLPTATAIGVLFQFLGGAIFLGIAENIFVSSLRDAITKYAPNVNSEAIVRAGATGLHKVVADVDMPKVVLAFNDAVLTVFYLGIAGGAFAFLASFGMEWRSVKGKQVVSAA